MVYFEFDSLILFIKKQKSGNLIKNNKQNSRNIFEKNNHRVGPIEL